jgi:protein TonB
MPDATAPAAVIAVPDAPEFAATAAQPVRGAADGLAAGADPDALRAYRIELASAARRFRNYPALARSRGWEGVVEVAIVTGPVGSPVVQLARTSGHAVLDEQAIDMLTRAVARTPLPDSLRSRGIRILLPIRFSLDE